VHTWAITPANYKIIPVSSDLPINYSKRKGDSDSKKKNKYGAHTTKF
jgi:hypothetical protein